MYSINDERNRKPEDPCMARHGSNGDEAEGAEPTRAINGSISSSSSIHFGNDSQQPDRA